MSEKTPKRILILGAGFAGLYTALHLEKNFAKDKGVKITLVNQVYIAFFPLLPLRSPPLF
jgi:NADH:quinone reductase (non-electrogenic)